MTKRSVREPETHRLTCTIGSEELGLLKTQLSAAVDTLRRAEEEKKDVARQLGEKVERAKKAVCDLNNETESGKGIRDVICTWRIETGEGGERQWYLRRKDTGEAISLEPLRADDLQETLFS